MRAMRVILILFFLFAVVIGDEAISMVCAFGWAVYGMVKLLLAVAREKDNKEYRFEAYNSNWY